MFSWYLFNNAYQFFFGGVKLVKFNLICILFLDVCYLRLDFEIFTIEGPKTGSTEVGGGECQDSFSVSVRLQLEFIKPLLYC